VARPSTRSTHSQASLRRKGRSPGCGSVGGHQNHARRKRRSRRKESTLPAVRRFLIPRRLSDFHAIVTEFRLSEKFFSGASALASRWESARKRPSPAIPLLPRALFVAARRDDLFHPAHRAAEARGCITCCDNTTDDWPVERAAENLLAQLDDLRQTHPNQRVALIADGELAPCNGTGLGGRNSAFVLACVERLQAGASPC